jgi:hypothetical protein
MPNLGQTLKGHNSETVHPFELKCFMEMYFSQLYQISTREVLEIDQWIAIDMLSMPVLGGFLGVGPFYLMGLILSMV